MLQTDICQVNGVKLANILFYFDFRPSFRPYVHLWALRTYWQKRGLNRGLNPGTLAYKANVMTTKLPRLQNNGLYKSLNACSTSEQKQNNDFYLRDNKRNVKNNTINYVYIKDSKTENLRRQFVYFVPYVCSDTKDGAILWITTNIVCHLNLLYHVCHNA